MTIDPETWSAILTAAKSDDLPRFRALITQIVRRVVAEHNAVVRPGPGTRDGRPYLLNQR